MDKFYPKSLLVFLVVCLLSAGTFVQAQTNIQVTKLEVSDTSPNELQNLTIEVNVKNNGPQATTALQVRYLLPSSMTFVSYTTNPAIPAAGTYTPGTGIWNIGALSSGTTVRLFIVAYPNAGTAGTTINSTANYVSSTPTDNNASDNLLTLSFVVNRPDILVTKSVNTSDPNVGDLITYSIKAKNVGSQDAPATGLVITDLLPAGLTYVAGSSTIPAGTTYNPATGAWTIGTLADNVELELKLAATVNAGTTGQTITNTASVTAIDQTEESTANNSASVPITVRFPDIQITKTVSNGPYNEGANLTYTVTVRNNGPANATNVKVIDALVNSLNFVSASATQGTYTNATGIWDVGALNSGQSRVLTIVASPVIGSSGTAINNVASLFSMDQNDPNTANNSASVEIEVAKVDLLLEKTVSQSSPSVGQTIEFSLKLTNLGPGTGTNIIVKDVLPAGLTFVAFTSIPSASTATQSGGTVTWSKSSMTPSNQTLKFTATVDAGYAARSITNTAYVESFQQVDPNLNNNTSSLTFTVKGADLRVTKTVSNVAPNPGDNITYTIRIKNNGPDKANDITLTDVIPTAGLTYLSSTNSQGNAYNSVAGTWFANDINSGDSATLTITAQVKPAGTTLGNSYNNTASITSVVEPDGITANNSASALFAVGNADLGITKTVSSATSPEGGIITYTLTVRNYGPHNAPLVVVNDLLPAEVTYTSHSGGTYNPGTGIWNIGTLNNGATTTLTINTTVKPGTAAKTVINTATVSSPMLEPVGATNPNTATATFKVNGADIAVTKTASATNPVQGSPLTYTITVTNNGPDGTTGLVIKDVLPANLSFISSSATVGSYNSSNGEWTIGTLANGASATLTINTTITNGGGFTNTASVIASTALDANTANNTASVFTSALKSFKAGACIIDMGVLPQTINNAMKPYGLVYQIVKNFNVPVYWAINPTKSFGTPQTKVDQPDFTVAGVTYYSGAFIIPAEFVPTVQALINTWVSTYPGLKVDCNRPAFNAPIHDIITSFPRAVLDQQNGDKTITAFYSPAGIPATAYRANGQPSNLTSCDDIYAMPHADPQNWVQLEKTTLDNFIKAGGWLFMACHSVSALESLVDLNGDGIGDLNYLSNAGLIPWGSHSDGTIPPPYYYSVGPGQYAASVASDPFMQFLGRFDGALQNGSEQINIPKSAGWRSTTTVAVWDHDHPQVISGQYPPGPAAALAYGRAFGNPAYGMIMEFTSHTFNGGTLAENIAAGRTYGNFLLQAGAEFKPKITPGAKADTLVSGQVGNFSVTASGKTAPITYQWTSSCGGTFSNATSASTSFTAPNVTTTTNCIIRLKVIDACGRENFEAYSVIIEPIIEADLAVVKTVNNSTPAVGSNVSFTITVTNNGPSAATGVTVNDLLPSGYTYVSDNGAGSYSNGTGVWTIGGLANGASKSLIITATVKATGSYANTATVTGNQTDPVPGNNTSTVTPVPVPQTDLAVVKTVNNATPAVGSNVIFTIMVTNNGPSAATGVTSNDLLPSGYTYVSDNGAGAYVSGTGVWTIGNLAIGASTSLQITATVKATGVFANTATVTGNQNDPVSGNNTSTVTPTPVPQTDLAVVKTVNNSSPIVGSNNIFTLTVTNNGPSAATGVKVNDLLPSGYTYVSDNGGGAYVSGTGVWTIGNMAIGASTSLQITATVKATGTYTNTATVSGNENDPVPANNTSTVTPTPIPQTDLAIVKTVSNATPVVGSTITFTLTVTNNGPSAATGVSVNDILPSGYTYISDNGAGAYVSGTGVWTIGNLANGASQSLQISVTVKATGSYTNTATVTGNQTDPVSGNNTSSVTPVPSPRTDLAIVKTVNNPNPAVNEDIIFTLTVTNNGPSPATGVIVNDLIPTGFTYVSDNGAGAYNSVTGVWTIGNLGISATVTLQITVKNKNSGNHTNTATVSGSQTDPVPGNNSSSVTTNTAQADLAIQKTVSNSTPAVGSNIVFTLTVTNNGPSAATSVSVTDLLPSGYTYVSDNGAGAYVSGTGVWTIGSLANGASTSLQITATVKATGNYANTASVTGTPPDPTPGNNTVTNTPTPVPQTDLAVVKTVNNPTPSVGSNIIFTLTVTNNGPSAATGVKVNDLLPSGYTYVSDNGAGAYVSGTGVWTIGNMAIGATTSLQITATVNATGTATNTATVTGNETDPVPANNSSSVTPGAVPQTDLAVVKTVNNSSPLVGSNIIFTLTVTNNGPSAATGVSVSDLLPSGYTYVSDNGAGAYASGTGVWTIGSLANGGSTSLQITATVNATGTYTNTATVSGNENDPVPGNNSSSVTPSPVPQTDLAIVKIVNNATPAVGSNIVFTLTVTNNGPSAATGVSVNDLLPSGYTYVSDNGAGAYVSGTGVWTIGNLANGASTSLQITATVNSAGTFTNTAAVSGNEADPVPGNNSSTVTPVPVPQTDLAIVKTIDNPTPTVGSTIVFTLTATNNGPSNATGVKVNDLLPSGYTYISDNGGGSYSIGTGVWTIGGLANGASTSLQITATVKATGTYANTATVTGDQNDPVPANNSSTVTPVPVPQTDLAISKTLDNATPFVGGTIVFTLSVINNGPSAATGVSVNDLLPSGYTYVSDNGAGAYVSGTGVWTIGNLANGASTTLQITATVDATGTYINTATVTGNENDPVPDNNTDSKTPAPIPQTDLAIVKTIDNPSPAVGSTIVFTLTVTNNGPSNATGVKVNDLLPAGYTYVSDNGAGAYVSGTGVWTIGNMLNGASTFLQITATVNASGTTTNTATVSGNEGDPVPGNNSSTITPGAVPQTDLSIVKTVNNSTPIVGSNIIFTLTVANNGPSPATGVSVSDLLPSGYTYVSDNGAGAYDNGTGVWTIGDLANAEGASLQITATVNATGTYANTATITGNENDPTPGNNTSTNTPVPVPQTDLAIVKTVNNATPTVGSNIIFTLTATNNGPSPATGVSVSDLIPSGYTYVSDNGVGAYVSGTGVWTIGNLTNGASTSLQITATVNATGSYANTATVTGNEADPVPGNNSSTVTTAPIPQTDLTIVKTVNNATPTVGSNIIFTLTVTNNGPSAATGVKVNDLLPSGYTYVSDNGAGAYAGGTGVWTIGNLANGASTSLQITATVNATGTYANTATVTGNENDPVPGNNTSTVTPAPVPQTDLVIVKTVNNATPIVGSTIVFTLTVTNNGPSAATGVSVSDLLPSGYTYVSDNGAGAYASGTGVWTIGGLANGANTSLQITATVNATGTYTNTATVSGNENDPVPGNNSSSVTPVPVPQADLAIVKTIDNPTPAVGSNIVFTLAVTNNGPSAATGVSVNDLLPSGYTYVSDNGAGAYVSGTGVWTIGNLANGANTSLQITATVNASGTTTNTATVTGNEADPVPANNSSTIMPGAVPQTDLSIIKTVNNATPAVGSNIVFTLAVTNNGPSAATGVKVNDLLPSGYTYISDNGAGTYVSGTGVWTIGNLASGANTSLQITATVNATGTYANTATVTGNENDPTPGNNSSTNTPVPVPQTDLAIVKTVSNATPVVGSNIIFTLTVTNNGPSAATGVSVSDLLPSGYTYVSDNGAGTYVSGTGVWTIGNMANGASTSLQITATVNATGSYANTATVTGNEADPVPGNNSSTVTPTPLPQTDLAIVKTVDNPTPAVGSTIVFTLTVTNNGPSAATGVKVNDLLPSGYTYVSDNGAGAYVSGTGVWTIGNLANGANTSLQITATVNASGTTTNTATVTGNEADPVPGNNSSSITPGAVPQSDLSIVKTVNNATPAVGSNIIFTLTVTNNGPSSATGVSVSDLLPSGYTYVSDNGVGAYVSGTGVWTIGNLASGANTSLQITATVNATGTYANTATVTGNENDPTPGNNSSTNTPVPIPQTDLSIVKTVNNPLPAVGSNIVFTLTVTNNGPSSATGVSVSDLLPSGYTYVSDNGVGAYVSGTGMWTIGNLANGASTSLQITATVNATGSYVNTATVTGNEADPVPGNNSSTVTTAPIPQTDLAIAKTVNNATPTVGSNIVFTLTVTNNGPSAATGVSVNDLLPSGYTYVSDNGGGAYINGTGVWTIGSLANGASTSLQITATANATGSYANTATVSGNENDPVPGNNSSTITPAPVPQTDLAIVKTVNNATPNVGSTIVFTLTVTNNGPSVATGVSVNDLLPSGYTYVSDNGAGAYVSGTGVWTIGNLGNGASTNLQITATVNATGTYTNTATVSGNENDPVPGNNSSTVTPVPVPQTDLAIVKTIDNPTPAVGSTVVFTLTVTNNGPSAATGVSVNDLLPSGYTYVSDNGAGAYVSGTGVWTIGNMLNGANTSLQITATVNASGTTTNTATVTGNEADPVPANNSSTIMPGAVPQTDLSIVKTANNATPTVGSNIIFTLTVTNNGPSAATGVSVNDLLPSGYTYVTDNGGGAYVSGTGVWTIGNLANGASTSLQITATVNATGTYANTATVTGNENDPTPGNNSSTNTPVPVPQTDLAIVKTVSNATPVVGSNIIFTLTVTNNGPSAATGVSVSDLLPSGYTYVSDNGAGTYVSGTGTWIIGGLANGASTSLQITATVNATGDYANTATVTGNEADPVPGNNSSTNTPVPIPQTDLAIVKTVNNPTPNVGSTIVFTLAVTNNGPSAATGVSVNDLLPSGYTYVSDNGAGTYVSGTGVWTIGNLANGASTSLQITAIVNASGTTTNTATVTGNEADPVPGNNSSSITPGAVPQTDLSIVKTVNNATPAVGSTVVFTLTVTNNGPSAATGVSVNDLLPSGYIYVSDNGAGAYVSGTGVWTIGNLASGANTSLQITATVNATGTYANTATVTGNENDPTPGNNSSTNTPVPIPQTDLAIVKTVSNATPTVGSTIVFTLTVTNNGPSAATGVSVSDLLPSGYTYVSDNGVGTYVSGTGTWIIGGLANGASTSLQITATVNATGDYANTATVTGNEADPVPGNNSSTNTPVPIPQTDLAIVKTVSNATPTVGSNIIFTLTVTNNGPSAATGVSVNDLLPSGYTYVSDNGAGTYVSGTGVWTIGNLANGANTSLQITATVNASGTTTNTATVTGNEADPVPANNSSTVIPGAIPQTDLSIVKTANNATPTVGSNIIFTLTVTNNGPSAATGVSVNDLLPSGYTYVTDNGGGAYVSGTGVWTIGNLANGASTSLQITATVNATGTYANTATVTGNENDPTPGNNSSTNTPVPVPQTDLAIVKTVSNATPVVGSNIIFTLTVTNNGPSAATVVKVNDLLPSGYTYVSDNGGGAYVSGTGVWTIGNLVNGVSTSLQITATVNATGSYANTATVSGNENDPTPGNNTSTNTPEPGVVIIATYDNLGTVAANSSITYPLITNDTLNGVGNFDPTLVNITVVSSPAKGTATINSTTGQVTYTANAGASGTDNLIYQICDVLNPSVCDTALVVVTIAPTIDAVADTAPSVPSGGSLTYPLLTNDTLNGVGNFDPALVTISTVTPPTKGTATINPATGEVTYTPTPGFSGPDSLLYKICDVLNPTVCDSAWVFFTIDPVIVATYDNLGTVTAGGTLIKPLIVNDTLNGVGNFDPTLVNITVVSIPAKGTASINPATGEVTYTANAGASGTDNLIYQICDVLNPSVCDTALVVVTIAPTIDAVADTAPSVPSGGSLTYPLLTNDTLNGVGNFDPALVTISTVTPPTKGTATINPATGEVTYTPTPGFSGPDSLLYKICDVLNPTVCDSAWVFFTIDPVIVATYDNLGTVTAGGTLIKPLIVNDTLNGVGNFDPTLVNITVVSSPTKGTASINPATGEVTYTANAGASGTDNLIYQICDVLNPSVCDTALVVVTISPAIDAVADTAPSVPSGGSLTYPLLTNDTLNGVGNFDPALVTISTVTPPTKGTATINPATGEVTYTPTPGFSGPDSLLYKICDVLNPTVCDSAWVFFTIDPVIVATYDNLGTVTAGGTLIKPLIVNDTLNGVGNFDPTLVNITVVSIPAKGTASINPATGEVTYTANAGASGTDNLIYQICDVLNPSVCDTALVVVTIAPTIDAVADTAPSVPSGGSLTYPLLTNDTLNGVGNFDPALVTISTVTPPTKGTATINPATGEVTYTPTPGFSGPDSLLYKICDVLNPTVCDSAWVFFTIDPVIVATYDNLGTVTAGGTLIKPLIVNDTLNGVGNFDPTLVNITVVSSPAKGTASINPATGEVTYTANAGASGTDNLIYQICDVLNPSVCDTALVVVTISPAIDAVADTAPSVPSGGSLTYPLLTNDTLNGVGNFDPALVTISTVTPPTKGTATINPATGEVTYTPTPGFSGPDSLLYKICDVLNPTVCDSAWVFFTIDPVIVATYDNLGTVTAGGTLIKPLIVNDTLNGVGNFDPTLVNITVVSSPTKGTASINPATGEVTYTANAGASGTDNLIYQICDVLNPSVCDTALVVVTIAPTIDAVADTAPSVPSGGSLTYPLLTNDTLNGVGNFDPALVTISTVTPPTKGTATINPATGEVTYTPTPGFSGPDSLLYKICDVLNPTVCDSAWVFFTIDPVIVATYDNLGTVTAGGTLIKPLIVNDTLNGVGNFDPTLVNITVVSSPAKGTASINPATGEVTYTANAGASGTDNLIYQICDVLNPSVCDTALVVVTIAPAIDAVADLAGNVPSGGSLTYPLLTNDTLNGVGNFDPTLVTITTVTPATKGTATINPATGEVTYTPNAGRSGADSLQYKICDVLNPTICDSAWVFFNITPGIVAVVDTPPAVASGSNLTYPLLINDTLNGVGNFDPALVTIAIVDSPDKGAASLNPATGEVTYTPNAGQSGADSLLYKICDVLNPTVCDSAWAFFNITPVVVAVNDVAGSIPSGSSLTYPLLTNDTLNGVGNFDPALVTIAIVDAPNKGAASINPATGQVLYTPAPGQSGADSLLYKICDVLNPTVCDSAWVFFTIEGTLVANYDNAGTVGEGGTLTYPLLTNDTLNGVGNFNPALVTISIVGLPGKGTASINPATGELTYTPNAGQSGIDSLIYQICEVANPTVCDTALVIVSISEPLLLLPKVYLQGSLFGVTYTNPPTNTIVDSLMRDDLRVQNLIPLTSPYGYWNPTVADSTINATVLNTTGPNAIVDWIFVELRSATDSTVIVSSRSALLQRDGDIVDLDGVSPLAYRTLSGASYYVAVRHRNHLGVMTANPIPLTPSGVVVDFRKPSTPTYLKGPAPINQAQVVVIQGRAMWAGNALRDKFVIYQGTANDVNVIAQQVLGAPGNTFMQPNYILTGYYNGDINMNGRVIFQGTGNDVEYIYQNIIKNHPGNALIDNFFVIQQQLPE